MNDYFTSNSFLKQNLDSYTSSLKIISVMKYYGLEEPDYQEVTHNFWFKLPLCLEWTRFMQKRHYMSLRQPEKVTAPGASGSYEIRTMSINATNY